MQRPAHGTLLANPKRLRTEEGARATDGLRADAAMVKRSETPCCRGIYSPETGGPLKGSAVGLMRQQHPSTVRGGAEKGWLLQPSPPHLPPTPYNESHVLCIYSGVYSHIIYLFLCLFGYLFILCIIHLFINMNPAPRMQRSNYVFIYSFVGETLFSLFID